MTPLEYLTQLLFWLGFYLLCALLLGWPILLAYALVWYVRRVDRGNRQKGFEVGRATEGDMSAPPDGCPTVVPTPRSKDSK